MTDFAASSTRVLPCRTASGMIACVEPLSEPPWPDGPLFAYGLLKRGELAHNLIQKYVGEVVEGRVDGCLRLRDGLPLLDPTGPGSGLDRRGSGPPAGENCPWWPSTASCSGRRGTGPAGVAADPGWRAHGWRDRSIRDRPPRRSKAAASSARAGRSPAALTDPDAMSLPRHAEFPHRAVRYT